MFSSTRNSLNTCSNFKLTVASITRRKEGGVDRKERGKEEAGWGEAGGEGGKKDELGPRRCSPTASVFPLSSSYPTCYMNPHLRRHRTCSELLSVASTGNTSAHQNVNEINLVGESRIQ